MVIKDNHMYMYMYMKNGASEKIINSSKLKL